MCLKEKGNLRNRVIPVVIFLVISVLCLGARCLAEDPDKRCDAVQDRWEKLMSDLKNKLKDYEGLRRTPLQQIVRHPLVDSSAGKTIAKQISEAIQVKEDLLGAKRKECLSILNLESSAFREFEQCFHDGQATKSDRRHFKKIDRQRRALIDKVYTSISEVRAVEGSETVLPYSQAYQTPNRRDNYYWQYYQQMQRGYWGR